MSTQSGEPLIIAHRGASHDAPENTVAAYKLGWEQGADGAETDVHITKDGKLVCMHDDDAERTAGSLAKISETNFDELRKLDVGAWPDDRYVGEQMPTLVEVLETVPEGKLFYVEIKSGEDAASAVPLVKADIDKSGIKQEQIRIISFSAEAIKASKEQMPEVSAYLLLYFVRDAATGGWSPTADEVISKLKACDADGVDINVVNRVDQSFIDQIKAAGYAYHVWTINSPHVAMRYAGMGVDSITTDRPGFIKRAIAGMGK
ncbi:Glycerophosphoryl diester phosphodiesterase [Poriferisphaera corsica]|uniref:Glycerophosphoryl diester phosphodiesterase n=1 Tax=Poriferisphaera corsica TaxID=2528020 RepID=A0A517YX38_9BACT|nr:glycerophosphodiester phosphodiesterase [Poriferisphaera corsica]QDU34791.1 Glycerophosphoryl diester phosphodiesterase [Poriferisphaera corsica]